MEIKYITIDELKEYIYTAFFDDYELIDYYDKNEEIKSTDEAIENVYQKISIIYPTANFLGVQIEGNKAGYFVCEDSLLISFGLNKKYRNKEILPVFWEEIKNKMGKNFQCCLYSYNVRAIRFLEKYGMVKLLENVTILSNLN